MRSCKKPKPNTTDSFFQNESTDWYVAWASKNIPGPADDDTPPRTEKKEEVIFE